MQLSTARLLLPKHAERGNMLCIISEHVIEHSFDYLILRFMISHVEELFTYRMLLMTLIVVRLFAHVSSLQSRST